MILTRIIFTALPEKTKELMQTLLSMNKTEGREKGCLSCSISRDIHNEAVFSLIEEWNTREDFNRHVRSENFSIFLGTKSLLAKAMEIKVHSVFHTEGNDAVYLLRAKGFG